VEADLIIIDEASMISKEIWSDLLSFNIPIIAYGDHYQLPPVGDDFNLMGEKLDGKLTEIVRQARDNEIIKLSMIIRSGHDVPLCINRDVAKIRRSDFDFKKFPEYSQIITGKNLTRVQLNQKYRSLYDRPNHPVRGDKMIFLKNSKDKTVFNGQQFVVSGCSKIRNDFSIHYYEIDDPRKEKQCLISYKMLNNPDPINAIEFQKGEYREDLMICDYSYAISVHKSQGSGWDDILLFDDRFGYWDDQFRSRWLYTAVTRAAKTLTWVV
jgi:exodeoxyribonuclease-5